MSTTHHEAKLEVELREKLGSRTARGLRAAGRLPVTLQFFGHSEEPEPLESLTSLPTGEPAVFSLTK